MRIGNFDSRRLYPCSRCGEMVYLTKEWKYPQHREPEPFQGYQQWCAMSTTDSGLEVLCAAAQEDESASALQDYRDNAVATLIKMNQLEIALGQRVNKQRREHG